MNSRSTFTLNAYEMTNLDIIVDAENWANRSKLIHRILRDHIEAWTKENAEPAESGDSAKVQKVNA